MSAAFLLAAVAFQAPIKPNEPNEIPFQLVQFGISPGLPKGVTVIQSADEYQTYMKKIGRTDLRKPTTNWKTHQVIAAVVEGDTNTVAALQPKRVIRTGPGKIELDLVATRGIPNVPMNDRNNPIQNVPANKRTAYILVQTPKFDGTVDVKVVTE